MINEICMAFNNEYEEKGDALIIDNYTLSPGSYVEFTLDDNGEVIDIFDVDKNSDKSQDTYKKFAEKDCLSGLISMNKPIDPAKVIHSNNMFSFYVKKENLDLLSGKLNEKIIEGYYDVLKNPEKKYKGKKNLKLYTKFVEESSEPDGEFIDKIQSWIKENIWKIAGRLKKLDKTYLKLFYQTNIHNYETESQRYMIPNIYNSPDYNVKIGKNVFGLSDFNMGLNSKKPYLENKTRKSKLPLLVDSKTISNEKRLFDYLMNCSAETKNCIYVDKNMYPLKAKESMEADFSGHILRVKKGKEVEILDYDSVNIYKYKLKKNIEIKPILNEGIGEKFELLVGNMLYLKEVKRNVNEVFFNKFLETNFFTEPGDISLNDSKVKECLLKYRHGFYTWFFKGEDSLVKTFWDSMTLYLLRNSIAQGNVNKAVNQFNLRYALIGYFNEGGKKNMNSIVHDARRNVDEKINIKEDNGDKVKIGNDAEYYFCIGQLLKYFYSLNKSANKSCSFINAFLNSENDRFIKERLRRLFVKYNYTIKPHLKFNNLYCMILAYVPENEVDQDSIIAGFLSPSLIYKKGEEN